MAVPGDVVLAIYERMAPMLTLLAAVPADPGPVRTRPGTRIGID
jgi:hypothetical protein